MTYSFRIRCSGSCPVAQRALIALAERGQTAEVEVIAAPPLSRTGQALPIAQSVPLLTVIDRGGHQLHIAGSVAMVDLFEDLFAPDSLYPAALFDRARARDLMELGCAVQQQLSLVTRAREANELDILVHQLRDRLSTTEAQVAERERGAPAFGNVDIVFAPTLWRLRLLSRTTRSYLLAGFPALIAWAERLATRPSVARILDDSAEGLYLDGLRQRGAIILDDHAHAAWAEIVPLAPRVRGAG